MVRPGYNDARRNRQHGCSGTGALRSEYAMQRDFPGCRWPGDDRCSCSWCVEHRWPMTDEEETDSESESESLPPATGEETEGRR